jgi:hypothetical protein
MSNFGQKVIKEINKFRANPKSIQHQCELIQKGLGRLTQTDPFLKEIADFIKILDKMKPLPELRYNEALTEAAKGELPNFRGRENYPRYKKGNSMKGIVPEQYMEASPALVADDGADEPIHVLTKTLLNRNDKLKEGRAILCDPKLTQVGVAHEEFQQENMVILVFSSKFVENSKPIKTSKNEFLFNIQYHESKDIKKPKFQAVVYHRIKGDIFGGGNFDQSTFQQKKMFNQGGNRPKLEGGVKPQPLRGTKSAARFATKTEKPRNPAKISGKNEKVQETSMKRRNDGTSTKTQTTTQSKVTRTTGGRGSTGNASRTQQSQQTTTTTTTTTKTRFRSGSTDKNTIPGAGGSSLRQKYSKKQRK